MQPLATDVARSVVCVSVLSTRVSWQLWKTAEPIAMPFGGADPPTWRALLRPTGATQPIATQRTYTLANVSTRRTRRTNAFAFHRKGWQDGDAAFCQFTLDTCLLLVAASSIVVLCMVHPPVGPEQSPLIPSLPHLLLYLLLSFTFLFFTRFIYFLAFPSLSALPE